jgi:hypothetical protein
VEEEKIPAAAEAPQDAAPVVQYGFPGAPCHPVTLSSGATSRYLRFLAGESFEEVAPATADVPQVADDMAASTADVSEPECVSLPGPDPGRPFWWFSSTSDPGRRIVAGRAIEEPRGSRLPSDADYWCHEGDGAWTIVDRPEPKNTPGKAPRRKSARPNRRS